MSTTTTDQSAYELGTTTGTLRLDPLAAAGAAAVISAAVMLLLGVFAIIGIYGGAIEMMIQWHMFFQPTVVGTLTGMIEAALISFVVVYPSVWLYNVFAR